MEVTRSLARFVVRSDYQQIPEAARHEAVRDARCITIFNLRVLEH